MGSAVAVPLVVLSKAVRKGNPAGSVCFMFHEGSENKGPFLLQGRLVALGPGKDGPQLYKPAKDK